MKTLDLKSLLIGVLLTMLIVAFMLVATASSAPRAWEYKSVSSVGRGIDSEVSKLGAEGWEVVGFTYARHPTGQGNDYSFYVLKRAKRSNWSWRFWK
ncbi:MAG TPA: hypothetical protein VJS65_16505 [Verrucomicrobiae bacterium]|nr:hypothetical protein [Verrucomicrobiae bacterium]